MIDPGNSDLLDDLVSHAVNLSIENVRSGGIPFTALVTDRKGIILGTGTNRVSDDCDPTAHAEIVAIRNACKHLNVTSLVEATLIASGEPCAQCYLSALWSGIGQIVFAVDRYNAAKAGFNYQQSYKLFAKDPMNWPMNIFKHETNDAYLPFDLWIQGRRSRVDFNPPPST